MSRESFSDLFKLPGAEEIQRWEAQYREMGEAIKELQGKRTYLERLIAAARGEAIPSDIPIAGKTKSKLKAGTWMHAIAEIVLNHPEGISYSDLRAKLPDPFRESVRRNPRIKAFYGALRRLEIDEVIARYRNHAFTPAGFKRYMDKIERGEAEQVKGNDPRHSPMADEVKAFLASHGASKVAAIRDHLCSFSHFRDSMKNHSAIYNVLRRLVDREELVHDKEAATYSLPGQEKAPDGNPAGALIAGEGATSPTNIQPSLRLIG